jgi:hypothetical protein
MERDKEQEGAKAPDIHDLAHVKELAREARRRANTTNDPDLARRLREIAVKHERQARKIAQAIAHEGES